MASFNKQRDCQLCFAGTPSIISLVAVLLTCHEDRIGEQVQTGLPEAAE